MRIAHLLGISMVATCGTAGPATVDSTGVATVLAVTPEYATVTTHLDRQQCWQVRRLSKQALAEGLSERHCFTRTEPQLRREQVGFRVKYRYRGRIGEIVTGQPPGDRLRLAYQLDPVHF